MRYRMLGSSGLEVSEIGFGGWGIGGGSVRAPSYGPTSDRESLAALERAFALGVTFFDTAGVYGNGRSEELIGHAFRHVRDRVVIASKVGFLSFEQSELQMFSPEHIRDCLEASLKRLGTDYLDLYQLHSPAIEALQEDPTTLDVLMALQKEGKILAFGISVRSARDGIVAISELGVRVLQVNLSMIDQRALDEGLIHLAAETNTGLIARTPLNFGFLSGKVAAGSFSLSDHRSRWPQAQIEKWREAPRFFAKLNDGKERTLAQLALQFCLAFQPVATVIPGMLTPAEVEENVRASSLEPLRAAEVAAAREIYCSCKFFIED